MPYGVDMFGMTLKEFQSKGGATSSKKMSKKDRVQRARNAAIARWAKKNAAEKSL